MNTVKLFFSKTEINKKINLIIEIRIRLKYILFLKLLFVLIQFYYLVTL